MTKTQTLAAKDNAKKMVGAVPKAGLPRLVVGDGTLEALKWGALLLMTLDHINKYLLNDSSAALFDAGRICMPLFGFVLAYNLARPGTLENGIYLRVIKRLAIIGAVASIPFILLGGLPTHFGILTGWWPFNILATLLVSALVMYLVDRGGRWHLVLAAFVFVIGGGLVEFWWPAVAMCLAAWRYCRRPSWSAIVVWVVSACVLYLVNWNLWALAAIPVVVGASLVDVRMPRLRWAFYVYYPVHLYLLWLIRESLQHPGFLSFWLENINA